LKSEAFADKKRVYAASPYILTTMIAGAEAWTAETIDERQNKLAELAVRTWPTKA
jgi:hypothetical protein